MAELRSYYLLDITKMATNFFSDYVVNFISQDTQQIVSVLNPEDSTNNEAVTTRLNEILLKDIKIIDYIRDHINDYVFMEVIIVCFKLKEMKKVILYLE